MYIIVCTIYATHPWVYVCSVCDTGASSLTRVWLNTIARQLKLHNIINVAHWASPRNRPRFHIHNIHTYSPDSLASITTHRRTISCMQCGGGWCEAYNAQQRRVSTTSCMYYYSRCASKTATQPRSPARMVAICQSEAAVLARAVAGEGGAIRNRPFVVAPAYIRMFLLCMYSNIQEIIATLRHTLCNIPIMPEPHAAAQIESVCVRFVVI